MFLINYNHYDVRLFFQLAQSNKIICQAKLSKRYETVQFETHYTDFLTKFLESQFTDRYADFKNIECLIQEMHNLFKEISKTDRIGPFNPNLPVLNISECDKIVRKSNSTKDILKKKSSTKHIRNKKVSQIAIKTKKPQNEPLGKDKRFKAKLKKCRKRGSFPQPIIENKDRLDDDDFNDEVGKNIARNLENLLCDDTFTPRYESKHKSDMFMIFQKSLNSDQLEMEAIEQYQNMDNITDINFNLLESQARHQYEP